MAEADESSGDIRSEIAKKNALKTASVVAALGLAYGLFYLPDLVVSFFKSQMHSVTTVLAGMGFSGGIAAIISSLIAAQDVLATGNFKSARFFQTQFPSEAIKKRYNCTQAEANELWFDYIFNPWIDK